MTDNLKLITMRDVQSESVDFLWEPYIPLGKISIVQGDPGCGKTTMMLAVAAEVTRGAEVGGSGASPSGFGGQIVIAPPSAVLIQTAEDGLADVIKPRLEQLGADCGLVHVIDESEQSLSLADERIERAIVKTNAKLVILDPIQAYCNGSDFHSVNGMRPLMKHLAGVAERTGAAIVIIGHLNKKGGKSAYRGLGSIDIYAAARSVLTVGKIPLDDTTRGIVHGLCLLK
jgi:predicted ATP-dependent serine protease